MSLWDNEDEEPWDKNVPTDLIKAVKHFRDSFEMEHFEFGIVTKALCFSQLHNGHPKGGYEDTKEYEKNLPYLMARVGLAGTQRYLVLLNQGTLPAIFKAFFDFYLDGLKVKALAIFKQLLEIGSANESRLGSGHIDWAKSQMEHLIRSERHCITIWVKDVCDEHAYDPNEDLDEQISWKKWQAPAFLIMKPSRYGPYDPEKVWDRRDSESSLGLLKVLADHYVLILESAVKNAAGLAAVELAKQPKRVRDDSTETHAQPTQAEPTAGDGRKHSQGETLTNEQVGAAASTFTWKELEDRFQLNHAKAKGHISSATFIRTNWESGGVTEEWFMGGSRAWQKEFEHLASIAARKLGCTQSEGANEFWLGLVLKWMQQAGLDKDKDMAWCPAGSVYDGKLNGTTESLRTERIAELSAMFCVELIARGAQQSAVSPPSKHSNMPPKSAPAVASTNSRPKARLNFRSPVKRAILMELTRDPNATDLAICRAFDSNGNAELPESWQPKPGERAFEKAYMDSRKKSLIEKMISKVRADMREAQLLPPR